MIVFLVIISLLLFVTLLLFGVMVFAIVLASTFFLAFLRFGLVVDYSQEGFAARVRVGFFSFKVYPGKALTKEEKQKRIIKRQIRKAKRKYEEKKPGGFKGLLEKLPVIKETFSRIRCKLLIKRLSLHYVAAGKDPSSIALAYGAANAVFGLIVPQLETNFKIKRRDFRVTADFESSQQRIYANASVSLAIWEAVYIASALLELLPKKTQRENHSSLRKEVKENG